MSGGDEQGFGVYQEPPFGRQSSASFSSLHDTLDPSAPVPQAHSSTTYSPLPSALLRPHNHSTSNHRSSDDQLEDHHGRDSPDPADYYRRGALSPSNVREGINNVMPDMAVAGRSAGGEKVSPMPANMLESSRTRRQPYRSTSDSPALAPSTIHPPSGARARQTSFKDLVNRFNSAPDQVLPLPSVSSRATSRTVSPSGSADGERNRTFPPRRQYRDSLPGSITSHPRAPADSTPSSPETGRFHPPGNPNGAIPPPLLQRFSESHSRRPLFGELLAINTQVNNTPITRLQRRGSDGSIPSPNPAFLDQHDQFAAKTPLTPTAWYLGQTASLEAVNAGITNGQHRRIQSDLDNPSGSLAEPWTSEMAVRAPLLRAKTDHESPPDSPSSRSRIPVSSHRLATASGPETLSPTSNPTFCSRSAAITSPPKGSSRLPIASPKYSPPRMPQDDPALFAPTSRVRRELTAAQTRNQLSESSRRLQAYIAAPPPKKSPPLRSSRPRQPVSHGASDSPRSKIEDRVSSLQKHADSNPRSSRTQPRKLPGLSNVNFEARRQHIQQAINRNKHEQREKPPATEIRRPPVTRSEKSHEDPAEPANDSPTAPSPTLTNTQQSGEMSTMVSESLGGIDQTINGAHVVPRLHLNTSLSTSDTAAPHTTMDSPTLGLPGGVPGEVTATNAGEDQPVYTDAPNTDAPNSAVSANSDETHVTTFDPEPQSGLLQRNPSISHRTLLNQIMNIRESSPSDDSCDEQDCSVSETDQESIQIMLGGTALYDSSSSGNTHQAQRPPMQPPTVDHQSHNRWGGGSWSSVQNQNSTCDEHCDESDDDLSLSRRGTEPPTETCSAVSTRPASIADYDESQPLQDHGVIGPNTLRQAGNRGSMFYTPPNLARMGGWDSKRVTQLYLEELTRGRSYSFGSAGQSSSEPQSHPANAREDEHSNSLTDDPVVVPAFEDYQISAKLSNTASLVGRDDWEHASPSIMDWMQVRAGDGAANTATDADSNFGEEVLTPRVIPPAQDVGESNGLGVSVDHEPGRGQGLYPLAIPPSSGLSQDGSSKIGASSHPPAQVGSGAPRATGHSPDSSEDSSFRRILTNESPAAPDSSSTSLAPSMEQAARLESRKSPSPEQRRLKKRQHIIKELVDTEHTFGHDMMVIEDIYKETSSDVLDVDDIKILFGNSEQVADFSDHFLHDLKKAARSIYIIPKAQRWTSQRNAENRPPQSEPPVDDQLAEYAGLSDLEKDRSTRIGHVFVRYLQQMEKVYTDYLKNHDAANKKLQALQRLPNVGIWLGECRNYASDLTTAWDLDSLLVKPVQRILKYPLLLQDLLESTPNDHPDRVAIANALEEVTNVSHRINESKKRADLVGQAVSRKRNQSDVRAGLSKAFGRRTEKFRQQVGLSDLFEDKTYDMLAQKLGDGYFQLQVVMRDVESYSSDVQIWVTQFSEYTDAMGDMTGMSPSPYPELETKWHRFKMTVQDVVTTELPEHLDIVRKTVITPMVEVLGLYNAPQRVMRKRDKRLPEYARYKAIKDRGDKPDKKTTEQGEQFLALNETLKDELPKLYALTAKLVSACLKNFVKTQTVWFSVLQQKIGTHVDFPGDLQRLVNDFNSDHHLMEARMQELSSCNGSMLSHSLNLLPLSPTGSHVQSPRRPSTVNSGRTRPGSMNDDSPNASRDFSIGSQSFQSPQMETHSGRSSRYRADSTLSSRVVSDTPNQLLQQVVSTPNSGRNSTTMEPFPSLPRLSLDTPFLADVINSTHNSQPASPTDRYSGFFSSAMPMSDSTPEAVPDRPRPTGPAALFCAASLYDFDIDARTEGGYPYLTYASGDIFDIVGEKGELWLARNQDDATGTVGWIWNKHFAHIR
ncbi:unnamed protein product [Penicillium salamii]|uniref:Dynamin-binding protein n=1 Tax=Penicillium salamii TaxID=1612424 RepID=A0A9W4IZS6_9EURO|nr:unnamed protein product [Penicillium salamii]CAG8220252.1 unnamed protein product [Penicillium salamii]CAG8230061.1 unnamed protein product [Penicillium salamii]CAG8324485.1 unnamed protein product [Penicillium salamii]CAG8360620.1 unnamed protein product [Penicillium salamii]